MDNDELSISTLQAELKQLRLRVQELERAALQAEQERNRLLSILDNLTDSFFIFDEQWRYTYINPQARLYTGKPWQDILGKVVWEEFPELIGSLYYQHYHEAVLTQQSVVFEIFSIPLDNWFDIHAYPISGGLAVYFRNISERKQIEAERQHLLEVTEIARNQAEAALQMRNEFLSSISHDLKTPIAVIKGNTQLFQHRLKQTNAIDPVWVSHRLTGIESSTAKMNRMVEDILNIARLQTGQELDLQMALLPILPLLERVCKEQQETTKRHTVSLQVLAENLYVQGDALLLDRAFTNLLSNAIKYSPKGGAISVTLTEENDNLEQLWVAIRIYDEGVGIPAIDLPSIFDPFYRATNVRGRIQGTGIGLSSVAQVIHQHGGTISVTSTNEQGSCFLLRLPAILES